MYFASDSLNALPFFVKIVGPIYPYVLTLACCCLYVNRLVGLCTLERHKHLAERHCTSVSLSTATQPCYGKPITSLCRELRNGINMHKIDTG